MKCQLCERSTDSGLCRYHAEAKRHVETTYLQWKEAYGEITLSDYLDRIIRNPETGRWAVEAAKLMRRDHD